MDAREPTRTRAEGTRVWHPKTGEERIAAFRSIVAECQYAKIDGTMVDLFSAGVVVQVHDALSEEHARRFCQMPADRMALVAFSVIKKAKGVA
jgi:hypothetical protein